MRTGLLLFVAMALTACSTPDGRFADHVSTVGELYASHPAAPGKAMRDVHVYLTQHGPELESLSNAIRDELMSASEPAERASNANDTLVEPVQVMRQAKRAFRARALQSPEVHAVIAEFGPEAIQESSVRFEEAVAKVMRTIQFVLRRSLREEGQPVD